MKTKKIFCYNPITAAPLTLKISLLVPYIVFISSLIYYIIYAISRMIKNQNIWDKRLIIITIVMLSSFAICFYLTFFTNALEFIMSLFKQTIEKGTDTIVPMC